MQTLTVPEFSASLDVRYEAEGQSTLAEWSGTLTIAGAAVAAQGVFQMRHLPGRGNQGPASWAPGDAGIVAASRRLTAVERAEVEAAIVKALDAAAPETSPAVRSVKARIVGAQLRKALSERRRAEVGLERLNALIQALEAQRTELEA